MGKYNEFSAIRVEERPAGRVLKSDRLGDADTPEAWQKAIDQGASGIQTNLPAELATYLRDHKLATH